MSVEQLIYTDQARGKGLDSSKSGYQIKACSDGLSAEARDLLGSICMHYGDVVYRYAPRTAIDQETAWRAQTDNLDVVPEPVLNAFPVIWSYDRLADDLFALTRVCYSGLTHDRRPGNFFAHAFVFASGNLAQHHHNPLTFSRSGMFRSSDSSDDTRLPTLPDLGIPGAPPADDKILNQAPYGDRLESLVSALCAATPATRPVVVCLADWCQAAPLAEALLNLLPPAVRCRTTVCTYESDRAWLLPAKTGRPTGQVAAHHLLILHGTDDHALGLRPDEYQSRYAVFNFVGNQFSALGQPSRLAQFAAACLHGERLQRLEKFHDLVERLGVEQNADAWDALVPIADLLDGQPHPESLAEAMRSLASFTTQPQQAQVILDMLWPHIQAMAQRDDLDSLTALRAGVTAAVDCLPPEAEQAPAASFVLQVRGLAGEALTRGQVRTAATLLHMCGRARDRNLLDLLREALGKPVAAIAAPATTADGEQWVDLLLDGLRLAEKSTEGAPPVEQLLVAVFRAAQGANRIADLWGEKRISESLVKPRLSGEWNAEKQALTQALVECVPAQLCPEANAWLNLKLLNEARPKGEQLSNLLAETAFACARCAEAEKLTMDLVRLAQKQYPEHEQLAITLGRMADASLNTAPGEKVFKAYQDTIKQITSNRHVAVHRKLAEVGGTRVLCRELLADVLPWNDQDSPRKLQHWRDNVLASKRQVMDDLRQQVANLLGQPGQAKGTFPLAEALIPKHEGKLAAGPGLLALYTAATLALPLAPTSWRQFLATPPEGLTAGTATRLRVLKFVYETGQLTGEADWSTVKFPSDNPAWNRDVPALNVDDKQQALAWCIDTFKVVGVTTPEEAHGLITLLDAVGEKARLAEAVGRLTKGRDPVTCVMVATAFARCALENVCQAENWGLIVKSILERYDKATRQLFEAHLTHRFGRRGEKYDERLRRLCETVGLALPQAATSSQSPPSAPSTSGTTKPGSISSEISRGLTEVVSFAKRLGGAPEAKSSKTLKKKK